MHVIQLRQLSLAAAQLCTGRTEKGLSEKGGLSYGKLICNVEMKNVISLTFKCYRNSRKGKGIFLYL